MELQHLGEFNCLREHKDEPPWRSGYVPQSKRVFHFRCQIPIETYGSKLLLKDYSIITLLQTMNRIW